MKPIRKIIICLLFLQSIFSGCSNFLEIPPTSIYSAGNLFQTADQVELNIKGIYNQLVADALYGRNMVLYYDKDNDLCQEYNKSSTGAPDGERRSIARYSSTETTKQLDNAWTALYSGIERANIAIQKIPEMDLYANGTDAEKITLKRCYGEALTLRAIMYFDLIRLWGDIPYKMEPSHAGENFNLPRTSRDTIYDHIIKDMIKAVDLVPWAGEVRYNERITKGAVKGLLARTCLHAAGYSLRWNLSSGSGLSMSLRTDNNKIREYYTIARDQLNDIMVSGVHKLNPNYIDIWKNICSYKLDQTNKENIFEIGFYSLTGLSNQSGNYGSYNGPESDAASIFKKCSGAIWAMPSFYLSFLPGDVRRDVSMRDLAFNSTTNVKGAPVQLAYLTVAKWRKEWSTDYPVGLTNFNYPLLRFADILLMYAEADSWLNNASTAKAIDALKQVRRRAFPSMISTINAETYPSDLAGFMNVIEQERAFELAFEGFRKFDLIRWNKLASKITYAKNEIAAIKASITSSGMNKPYNGSISNQVGVIFPKVRWYRDEGGTFVKVVTTPDDQAPPLGTGFPAWKSVEWVGSKFASHMEYFAVGFVANKSELFPIPKVIRDVSPALSQLPGF